MRGKFLFIALLFLLISQSINAQYKISISLGGGYLSEFSDFGKTKDWQNGYVINLSSEYFIVDDISIFLNSSFQNLFFTGELLYATQGYYGGNYSIDGMDRNSYEISLGGRLYDSINFLRPYLTFSAGILAISDGRESLATWPEGGENNKEARTLTKEGHIYSQITLGFGSEILLSDNIKIILEAKYLRALPKGPDFIPILTALKIGL